MIAETAAVIASIKGLRDLTAALKESAEKRKMLAAVEDVQTRFIQLQGVLMESQHAQTVAEDRARVAEEKCKAFENWSHEAKRYTMTEVVDGVLVYSLKAGVESSEPPHSLCANCFSEHWKSILQLERTRHTGDFLKCPRCEWRVNIDKGGHASSRALRPPMT